MKNIFLPIIVLIGICIHVNAQETVDAGLKGEAKYTNKTLVKESTKSNKEIKGDKYSFRYLFEKAIDSYTHSKQLTNEGQRRLAEAYYNMNMRIEAEVAYLKLINLPGNILPEDYFNYAMVLKTNGKYDESNKWMSKFNELKPEDLRAKDYVANNNAFTNMIKDNNIYIIKKLNINTQEEDFGTSYYKDQIIFSSSKSTSKMIVRNYNWTGKPFWDMYISNEKDGQLTTPKIFDKSINSKLHDGPASFSNNGTYMAYTSNNHNDKTKDKIVELQINFSNLKDGKWSTPEPFILNSSEYSVGHPSLTSDGKTMFFTSDMSGGYGGADIYKVTKDAKGTWGKAENLGNKINTEGDEMFPFMEEKNAILFFTSNGRYGLGGLDIFICPMNGSEYGNVYNAGFPLNTQYNDFAVIIDSKLNKGYFSSDRVEGSGGDDIYSFNLLNALNVNKKIIGITQEKNGNPIPYTFIKLLDNNGNLIDTMTTKDNATYSFLVDANKNFKLIGKKEKYNDGDTLTNTFGKENIVTANVILLSEKEIISQKIKVAADLGQILELNNIYFDLNKYSIRNDAEIELAKIITIMNDYPDMVVELRSYTDCRSSEKYNQILSDNRAKASANYIKERITNPKRIYGKGYGETDLVNSCPCKNDVVSDCSETEHQQNRRTEFVILKK